jgi:predicted MPP superfamily phosphohydrolase
MEFIQSERYLPRVTVLVNQNGNLVFKSEDIFAEDEQLVEISKELFLLLLVHQDKILEEMENYTADVSVEKGENDA